jgi:hypothetical protein
VASETLQLVSLKQPEVALCINMLGSIAPNANGSKVHSQYQMVCFDDKTGLTDFAAAYNSPTKTSWGMC